MIHPQDLERLLPIVTYVDPRLREPSVPVEDPAGVAELAERMIETMKASSAAGLAAPQVMHHIRMFVYDAGHGPQVVINPEALRAKGVVYGVEGCLSVPGLYGVVPRAKDIRVRYQTQKGKSVTRSLSGLEARVFQHELDHLDGILYTEKVRRRQIWAEGQLPEHPDAVLV